MQMREKTSDEGLRAMYGMPLCITLATKENGELFQGTKEDKDIVRVQ